MGIESQLICGTEINRQFCHCHMATKDEDEGALQLGVLGAWGSVQSNPSEAAALPLDEEMGRARDHGGNACVSSGSAAPAHAIMWKGVQFPLLSSIPAAAEHRELAQAKH